MPRRWIAALLPLALAGCASAAPVDGRLVVTLQVTGQVRAALHLAHAGDDRHRCTQPQRVRLATAQGPAPPPEAPPNQVLGYEVRFGPDFPPGPSQLSTEWVSYGPQAHFALYLPALAGQLDQAGAVRLGPDFTITVAAGGALWSRQVEGGQADASVTIAPDGRGGQFIVGGLVRQVPHGRMPESDAIAVAGTWRCP